MFDVSAETFEYRISKYLGKERLAAKVAAVYTIFTFIGFCLIFLTQESNTDLSEISFFYTVLCLFVVLLFFALFAFYYRKHHILSEKYYRYLEVAKEVASLDLSELHNLVEQRKKSKDGLFRYIRKNGDRVMFSEVSFIDFLWMHKVNYDDVINYGKLPKLENSIENYDPTCVNEWFCEGDN